MQLLNYQNNRIKFANEINFFVRLKYQSGIVILSVGIKYSVRDILVKSLKCLTRKVAICVTNGKRCQRLLWHQLALANCEFH